MNDDLKPIKKRKKFFKSKNKNKSNPDINKSRDNQKAYSDIIKKNEDYEKYYKIQNIVNEDEWHQFLSCLKEPLPSSFRITSYGKNEAKALLSIVDSNEFKELIGDKEDSDCPLSCIPWYPNRYAWNINISRVEIRKSQSFRILQNFLISETDSGYISRQEAVSMIPPLLLDVKPHHRVLDMCAAPGSKTAQIIELLHSADGDTAGNSEGAVVANDVDNKRCYMLVHQSKRLHSPCCVITNHDAAAMPPFYEYLNEVRTELQFDRILCDVPCSGDGTIRKNYDVWTKWNVANGNNFHGIQCRIARRGLEMLKKDGIMVYSTCSLNPIEDEAVIASLLNSAKGGAQLEDVSNVLPNLKYCNGLEKWTVMTREMVVINSVDEVEDKYKSQIRESLFPPKNADKLNLKRCIRILPHLQNTGGFFVAVIRKTVDKLVWESNSPSVPAVELQNKIEEIDAKSSRPRKKRRMFGYKEDPFIFFDENESDWPKIKSYYGIKDMFPFRQLAHRCSVGKKRNIYFLTEAAKRIIADNEKNIRFINAGVRLLSRSDDKVNPCGFRLTQEGLPSLYPYLTSEKAIEIETNSAKLLLSSENVALEDFSELDSIKFSKLNSGSCVLVVKRDVDNNQDMALVLPMCAWKGKNSMRAYIAKNERIHFLRMCGADVTQTEARRSTERDRHKKKDETEITEIDSNQTDNTVS